MDEVQVWEAGLFRGGFRTAEQLRGLVTRSIHEWEIARAAGPLDAAEVLGRALAALPGRERRGGCHQEGQDLVVAIAAGPSQTILRPSEIESQILGEELVQRAMFGSVRLFDMSLSTSYAIKEDALVITQAKGSEIRLDAQGSLRFSLPLSSGRDGWPIVIEEDVQERLGAAVKFAAGVLDHVDPTQRLTHVVIAATLNVSDAVAWRTRSVHSTSRQSFSIGMQQEDRKPVHLTPPLRPRQHSAMTSRRSSRIHDPTASRLESEIGHGSRRSTMQDKPYSLRERFGPAALSELSILGCQE